MLWPSLQYMVQLVYISANKSFFPVPYDYLMRHCSQESNCLDLNLQNNPTWTIKQLHSNHNMTELKPVPAKYLHLDHKIITFLGVVPAALFMSSM